MCGFTHIFGISIHAPARGATCIQTFLPPPALYFNPRTREGCDVASCVIAPSRGNFNPRTREGCDRTRPFRPEPCRAFQSTHPRGVRLCDGHLRVVDRKFQSTHPRGVRQRLTALLCNNLYFNPRTREGCDLLASASALRLPRFQSTHPRGVRPAPPRLPLSGHNFNPRTREGCDHAVITRL